MKYIFFVLLFITSFSYAQVVKLKGVIKGNNDLFGVHVINNNSFSYTVTNVSGEFEIKAKTNDTIVFSSILFRLKKVVVKPVHVKTKYVTVFLEEFTNQLSEVVIGKVLTGDLSSDIKNQGNAKQINFADVGIPGYKGKPLTQNQSRLKEASSFSPTFGGGIGGGGVGLQLNPLINAITGRTKMLKEHVEIERRTNALRRVKNKFAKSFFDEHPLPVIKRNEFFVFCSEHVNFLKVAEANDLLAFQFLQKQYKVYLQRITKKK